MRASRVHYGWVIVAAGFSVMFLAYGVQYAFGLFFAALSADFGWSRASLSGVFSLYAGTYSLFGLVSGRLKPLHLLDCCLETDNATALVVTAAERARDCRARPVHVMAAAGRVSKPRAEYLYNGRITQVAGVHARELVFPAAGVTPADVDVTGAYDAFTFTAMLQLEEFGFCPKGEGGAYVASGAIELGGQRPNNTSGGHLCEGYTHGMSMVIENVRQLRGTVDDYCPGAATGAHTYDYRPGGCRQVRDAEVAMNMGWATPATGSALILRR